MKTINGKLVEYQKMMYQITHKRTFSREGKLSKEDVEECFGFAYEMAFGKGMHRKTRSGGEKKRKSGEIFIDTFQGKIAEYAMYRYLQKNEIETSKPDMNIEGYGVWDSFDLEYAGLHMAVKSTKFYGNLLLLETKDWNDKGEYIPNEQQGVNKFDMFILIRISPDAEAEMKRRMLLYTEKIERNVLEKIICGLYWEYDIAGYITNKDFIRLIQKGYILPKNAILNGKIRMDAENYYVQSGDMRTSKEMIFLLKNTNKRSRKY